MYSLCYPLLLFNSLTIAFVYSVIARNDDQHLLSFVDPAELTIKASESVAEVVELLDWELTFELIEEDCLMVILIESSEVVIVGALIETDSTLHEPLDEVSLAAISLSMQPKVALLILSSDANRVCNCCKVEPSRSEISPLNSVILSFFLLYDYMISFMKTQKPQNPKSPDNDPLSLRS